MYTIDDSLVQAHQRDLQHAAQADARARRVRSARRWHRRAERAAQRASRAEAQIR